MNNPDTGNIGYTIHGKKIRKNRSIRLKQCSDSVVFLIFHMHALSHF